MTASPAGGKPFPPEAVAKCALDGLRQVARAQERKREEEGEEGEEEEEEEEKGEEKRDCARVGACMRVRAPARADLFLYSGASRRVPARFVIF